MVDTLQVVCQSGRGVIGHHGLVEGGTVSDVRQDCETHPTCFVVRAEQHGTQCPDGGGQNTDGKDPSGAAGVGARSRD